MLEGETILGYLVRLGNQKEDTGLTWNEIATLLNEVSDVTKSGDAWRKQYYRICDSIQPEDIETDEAAEFLDPYLEYRKERVKVTDERTQVNAIFRSLAREDTLREIAHDYAEVMVKKRPFNSDTRFEHTVNTNCGTGLLLISDWHYGVDIDNTFNRFNPTVCGIRLQRLEEEVKNRYKGENLVIFNLGDMIAGNIHLPIRINSRLDVVTQVMEVAEILAQFIQDLSSNYKIRYYSCVDNHSRIDPNKKEALQLESFSRIIDWYLEERLACNKQVNITPQGKSFSNDIIATKIEGQYVVGVHGDKDKQNSLITKMNSFLGEHVDLICSAHYHHFNVDEGTNTVRISNGSLMGTDQYAEDLRLCTEPSQTLVIVKSTNVVDSIHKIIL